MLNSLGSFQTWVVVTLGQLSPWGSFYLGSCPTWAVVQPGQLSYLGSCLPGQLFLKMLKREFRNANAYFVYLK